MTSNYISWYKKKITCNSDKQHTSTLQSTTTKTKRKNKKLYKMQSLQLLFIFISVSYTTFGFPTNDGSKNTNNKLRPWEKHHEETKPSKATIISKQVHKQQVDSDFVDIPEDLYNAVKPITQFFFNKIKDLMIGNKINTATKPAKKTKKISKELLKVAVAPLTAHYANHMKAIMPLGSSDEFSSKNQVNILDPNVQRDDHATELYYRKCVECEAQNDYGEYSCVMCCWMHGIVCCYPYQ